MVDLETFNEYVTGITINLLEGYVQIDTAYVLSQDYGAAVLLLTDEMFKHDYAVVYVKYKHHKGRDVQCFVFDSGNKIDNAINATTKYQHELLYLKKLENKEVC